ncbi:MAG: hypothetical protein ACYCZN_14650 [Candidatus Dormibacteria bacterium]
MIRLPGSTFASGNAVRLPALALGMMTPRRARPVRPASTSTVVFDRKRIVARGARPKYLLADLASPRITTHHDSDKLAQIPMKRVWARS